MPEKISVITISYNSKATIENTFQSILEQQYRPLEYVLVDGGSTDGTIDLIEKYIPLFQSKGIEVSFKSEKDNGISDAFNKGISRASGDIIGIINSDDQLLPNALEKVEKPFCNSDVEVVCGDCLWVDNTNNLSYVRKSKLNLKKLKYEMVLMHPTCFVRKIIYEKYGMFDVDLRYVMDKDLMARFYRNGVKFHYIPEVLTSMSAGGASDVNVKRVFDEGVIVATRNGVPKIYAIVRSIYKGFRLKVINKIKKSKIIWKLLKG